MKVITFEEIKQMINEISDYSGAIPYPSRESFWKQPKYIEPNMALAQRVNHITSFGRIPQYACGQVTMQIANRMGLYPVKMDAQRTIFISLDDMVDCRDGLKEIFDRIKSPNEQNNNPVK